MRNDYFLRMDHLAGKENAAEHRLENPLQHKAPHKQIPIRGKPWFHDWRGNAHQLSFGLVRAKALHRCGPPLPS
jgi:hypothetical protein